MAFKVTKKDNVRTVRIATPTPSSPPSISAEFIEEAIAKALKKIRVTVNLEFIDDEKDRVQVELPTVVSYNKNADLNNIEIKLPQTPSVPFSSSQELADDVKESLVIKPSPILKQPTLTPSVPPTPEPSTPLAQPTSPIKLAPVSTSVIAPSPNNGSRKLLSLIPPQIPVPPTIQKLKKPTPPVPTIIAEPKTKFDQETELHTKSELTPTHKEELSQRFVPFSRKKFPLRTDLYGTLLSHVQDSYYTYNLPASGSELIEMTNKVAELESTIEKAVQVVELKPGALLFGKSYEDDMWYRCQATQIIGDLVDVDFFDFGVLERLPKDRLRYMEHIAPEFMNIPALAIPVLIRNPRDQVALNFIEQLDKSHRIFIDEYNEERKCYIGTVMSPNY